MRVVNASPLILLSQLEEEQQRDPRLRCQRLDRGGVLIAGVTRISRTRNELRPQRTRDLVPRGRRPSLASTRCREKPA